MPALLPILLTPGFIGTVVFFHQVHLADVKGWSLAAMAPGYSAFAVMTVVSSVVAGWAADRFGSQRLLPLFLIPMGIGIALVGPAEHVAAWYLALGIIGITQGMASALWGVLLPHVYGTRHLGSIRSMTSTVMVISTAIGPGITGVLIDSGIDFPTQSLFMGGWCLCLSFACVIIQRPTKRCDDKLDCVGTSPIAASTTVGYVSDHETETHNTVDGAALISIALMMDWTKNTY